MSIYGRLSRRRYSYTGGAPVGSNLIWRKPDKLKVSFALQDCRCLSAGAWYRFTQAASADALPQTLAFCFCVKISETPA